MIRYDTILFDDDTINDWICATTFELLFFKLPKFK